MKYIVLASALLMPFISWLAQRQVFGPDNATLSARYPTLIVAAGYAFAIWGVIFLLDLVFGVWQLKRRGSEGGPVDRLRALAAIGFALTATWMVVFPLQMFWLALLVMWGALLSMVGAATLLARSELRTADLWLALLPLSLHAGWLSLAAFLNTAQVVVAYELLSTQRMLPWSLALWALAAGLLLAVNARLRRRNHGYVLAALWGLAGVFVGQSRSSLDGATVSAWVAVLLGVVLLAQTLYLHLRRRELARPANARPI